MDTIDEHLSRLRRALVAAARHVKGSRLDGRHLQGRSDNLAGAVRVDIAVSPSAQERGIGTRLLALAEDHVRRHGLSEMRLYTNEAMTENIATTVGAVHRDNADLPIEGCPDARDSTLVPECLNVGHRPTVDLGRVDSVVVRDNMRDSLRGYLAGPSTPAARFFRRFDSDLIVAAVWRSAHAVAMKTFVKALIALGPALMMAAAPATAASAEAGGNSGWVPFQTPSFTVPAGVACSFELHGEVVYDHEYTQVLETFPDGRPKVQEFQGALGVVFANVETGESARRDASGTLRATRDGDGGAEFVFEGNGIAPILAGSPSPGIYVVSGHNVLVAHPDGSREFTLVRGTLENMCQTLA